MNTWARHDGCKMRFADGFSVCNTCTPDLEEALAYAIEQSEISAKIHSKRIERLRKQLGKDCRHPVEHRHDFQWEHDNGYGRQTMITGVYCRLCKAEQHWKGHGLWHKEGSI